jgi:hypothetical protein
VLKDARLSFALLTILAGAAALSGCKRRGSAEEGKWLCKPAVIDGSQASFRRADGVVRFAFPVESSEVGQTLQIGGAGRRRSYTLSHSKDGDHRHLTLDENGCALSFTHLREYGQPPSNLVAEGRRPRTLVRLVSRIENAYLDLEATKQSPNGRAGGYQLGTADFKEARWSEDGGSLNADLYDGRKVEILVDGSGRQKVLGPQ